MAGYVNIGGVWKETSALHANVGGVQKEITQGYTNIGGVWKPIFDSVPKTTNFADNSVFDYYSGGDVKNDNRSRCYNSRNSNNIYGVMYRQGMSQGTRCLLTTKKAVDMSKIGSVSVNCTIKDMSGGYEYEDYVYLWICTQKPTSHEQPTYDRMDSYWKRGHPNGTFTPTLTIDTSDLEGRFYVAIGISQRCSASDSSHIGGAMDEVWIYAPITFS